MMEQEPTAYELFSSLGGKFHIPKQEFGIKLLKTRAFIFDWDGVFTDGRKFQNNLSSFSEVDSMGLNLLRFGWYLLTGEVPLFIIITGVNNATAVEFAKREKFDLIYQGFKDKKLAFKHLLGQHPIQPSSFAFFYDDVLDLSLCTMVGMRFLVERKCNPAFNYYVEKHYLADYSTFSAPGDNALRECAELCLMSAGVWQKVLDNRIGFSISYQKYWELRQGVELQSFVSEGNEIIKSGQ